MHFWNDYANTTLFPDWLTVSDVLWTYATDMCPVIRHLLRGFHIFVIDTFPKLVY